MAKAIKRIIKLQIPAGGANPAPPVGSTLGQFGVNIQQFCQQFNEATKMMGGELIPVVITIYEDRSFDFILKNPPVSFLLKKAAGIEKGSRDAARLKVGKVTKEDIKKIAQRKLVDLNTDDLEKAMKVVEGTAKQMGLEIVE